LEIHVPSQSGQANDGSVPPSQIRQGSHFGNKGRGGAPFTQTYVNPADDPSKRGAGK